MKNSTIILSTIVIATITATPVFADGFFDNLKKDFDAVIGGVQGGIEDITEGKEDVEETVEDAEQLQQEFTGVGNDEPRYDSPWVAEVQQRLVALGLDPGPVDGAFGKKTGNAIVIFQKISDLNPDGNPRPSMMRALRAKTQNVQTAQKVEPSTQQTGAVEGSTQSAQDEPSSASANTAQKKVCSDGEMQNYQLWGCSEIPAGMCWLVAHCGLDPSQSAGVVGANANTAQLPPCHENLVQTYKKWNCSENPGQPVCKMTLAQAGGQAKECDLDPSQIEDVASANQTSPEAVGGQGENLNTAGAVAAQSPSNQTVLSQAAETTAIVSNDPRINGVNPVIKDGRLLTGYPLTWGRYNTEQVMVGSRERVKSHVELARYIDLLLLNASQDILDRQDNASAYSVRFLHDQIQPQYFVGCNYGSCSTNSPFDGWAGANEFERENSFRQFVEQFRPGLVGMAPAPPVKLIQVLEVEIQSYDKEASVFPIKLRRPGREQTIFGSFTFAISVLLEQDYHLPENVPIALEDAPSFIGQVQDQSRRAYLALELILRDPKWDDETNQATMNLSFDSAELYADPDLTHKMHEFRPEEPEKELLAQNPNTATEFAVSDLPLFLIAYKYAPETFSDEFLLTRTKRQMAIDHKNYQRYQYYSKYPKHYPNAGENSIVVFSKDQIEGKSLDFSAPSLLPFYKNYLTALAAKVSSHLTISRFTELQGRLEYDHSRKVLLAKPIPGRPEVLMEQTWFKQATMRALMPVAKDLAGRSVSGFPLSLTDGKLLRPRQVKLALDRDVTVPPVPLSPDLAEDMWSTAGCSSTDQFKASAAGGEQLEQYREKCHTKKGVVASVDFEITGVDTTNSHYIINATVLSVRVENKGTPKWQKIFAPEDFSLNAQDVDVDVDVDVAQSQADEAAAAKQQEANLAVELEEHRERIASSDIIGIGLDMPFTDAVILVRKRMEGEIVFRHSTSRDPLKSNLEGFYSHDQSESISLIRLSPESNELVGVVRMIGLPKGISEAEIIQKLKAKYGDKPDHESRLNLLWTSSHDPKLCNTSLFAESPMYNMVVTEGSKTNLPPYAWWLKNSAASGTSAIEDPPFLEMSEKCGPTVKVKIRTAPPAMLVVALYDMGKLTKHILETNPEAAESSEPQSKDLDL
jgi:hypothetical protein